MVKRQSKSSMSEEEGEAQSGIVNQNGKRPNPGTGSDSKKRIKGRSLYRQPTATELNRLQETENLFNSNLFRLQVEEVLAEVKVKEKHVKRFNEWFGTFKKYLLTMPEDNIEYDLTENVFSKAHKVKIPIDNNLKEIKVIFKFHKFNDIELVGSYSLGSSINSKLVIDIQIVIPAETFTKNDSINYKYHKKRAAYLAYLAAHLKKHDLIEEVKFTSFNGDHAKPVIDLKPSGKLGNHVTVRINLVTEAEAFKLHRFSPTRNNVRESWLLATDSESDSIPTPYYNNSVLSDLTAVENQKFLQEILQNCDNLKQAIVLLKIWITQRKLQVSGHIISMLVAYLVQTKRINNIMSSYQIVRNVWIALKSSEWDVKGISLNKSENTPNIEEYQQHFGVVFLDRTGYYNICWKMCRGTYNALRRESSLAVDMLDNPKLNSFIPLFMTPVSSLLQFDHILTFKNISQIKESIINKAAKETRLNYGLDQLALVTNTLHTLLTRGLSNRVDLVLQIVDADLSWPVHRTLKKAMKSGYEEKLSFGLILNPDNAMNVVDRGPPANLPEAVEFRAFWGEKSELRRFQDGAITEACVWTADTLAERRSIVKQIIDHLLQLKYDVSPSEWYHVCDQLSRLTVVKSRGHHTEELSLAVLQAFDDLRRDLRSLDQLPLDISAVYGVSPVFSYSSPVVGAPPPAGRPRARGSACLLKDTTDRLPPFVPANCAVIELGHSGKWPGDLEAFRCLKAAFHLQIAERLQQQHSLASQAHPGHVDVLKAGHVFRLAIAHPKELTLMKRGVDKGVVKLVDNEGSRRMMVDTILMPRLRGALHGLHQKYPAFGPTACLVKRWVSCHLLQPLVPDTLLELLTAVVFLQPAPLVAPHQPTMAFFRVLTLLAHTDWSNHMIVLDFNDDMTREEIMELERKFNEKEGNIPPVYIVTSYDGDLAGVWGEGLTVPALARVQALARATLNHVETQPDGNLLCTFVPTLSGYDVLIHLKAELVGLAAERVGAPPRGAEPPGAEPEGDLVPVVEFDVVRKYLNELQSAYGNWALFFHDGYGGDVIAVLWTPGVRDLTDLQVSNANALKPVIVKGERKYKVNLEAIVEDFKVMGEGLVKDVVVCS